jgi:hypothetical protein
MMTWLAMAWLEQRLRLSRAAAAQQMQYQEDHCNAEQNVDQSTSDVKRQPKRQPGTDEREEKNHEQEIGNDSHYEFARLACIRDDRNRR